MGSRKPSIHTGICSCPGPSLLPPLTSFQQQFLHLMPASCLLIQACAVGKARMEREVCPHRRGLWEYRPAYWDLEQHLIFP